MLLKQSLLCRLAPYLKFLADAFDALIADLHGRLHFTRGLRLLELAIGRILRRTSSASLLLSERVGRGWNQRRIDKSLGGS